MLEYATAAIITAIATFVFMGTITTKQTDKIKELKSELFLVREELIHALEGQDQREWMLRSNGIDCIIERGRPDLPPTRRVTRPPGELIDLTWVMETDEI